jgi:collagenase-like PrtC family protease
MTSADTDTRITLTVGPVLPYWPRETLMHFYAEVADSAADTVVLGEVVCARRHEMKPDDWVALARDLAAAGKEVVLATQALIESEGDLRTLRRIAGQGEFLVEAGDASALRVLTQMRVPFALGPHINVYSAAALAEYAKLGAARWVAPVELPLQALGRINPPSCTHVHDDGQPRIPTEAWGFGRLPLAFSARCFTARHHRLGKDQCGFRCRDDADGLLLATADGRPFLALNGIQTQSAAQQCLIGEREALREAGVTRLRLSPSSRHFATVIAWFATVMNEGGDAREAIDALQALSLPGGLVNGFVHGQPGIDWRAA